MQKRSAKIWFFGRCAAATAAVGLIPVASRAADVTTNDILALADQAKLGFMTGFNIGMPLLILMLLMGWVLFGLRRGLRGKK